MRRFLHSVCEKSGAVRGRCEDVRWRHGQHIALVQRQFRAYERKNAAK